MNNIGIDKISNKFKSIKHLSMNAPHDQQLSEIRQSFELDIDSIAGLLSFETNNSKSPYIKQVLNLPQLFRNKLLETNKIKPLNPEDIKYQKQLEEFLNNLIEVTEDLSKYLKEQYRSSIPLSE